MSARVCVCVRVCEYVCVCVFVGLCACVCGQELNCNEPTVCVYLRFINVAQYIGSVHKAEGTDHQGMMFAY